MKEELEYIYMISALNIIDFFFIQYVFFFFQKFHYSLGFPLEAHVDVIQYISGVLGELTQLPRRMGSLCTIGHYWWG